MVAKALSLRLRVSTSCSLLPKTNVHRSTVDQHFAQTRASPKLSFASTSLPRWDRSLVERLCDPVNAPPRVSLGEHVTHKRCTIRYQLELLPCSVPTKPCRSMLVRLVQSHTVHETLSLRRVDL